MATVDISELFLETRPPGATVDISEVYLQTDALGSAATVDISEVYLQTAHVTVGATVDISEMYLAIAGDTSLVHRWILGADGVLHPSLETKILDAHGALIS